ncbi:MAG: TIGR00303 family protein [Helicobacteraceae bacterium]|nr:TIGR00303 family protein [Helicobacteraceae bacterium]
MKYITKNKNSKLPSGKADFLLAASVTKTCEIEGITQAGIPGLIPLTPTLDAEFISTGKVFSLENIAETPKGVPTPALITRAVTQLKSFNTIKILDLGMSVKPKESNLIDFGIKPSQNIANGSKIDAKEIFNKAREYARGYKLEADYIILGESTPAGTTTATATAIALGYECKDAFSSSFKNNPLNIKEEVVKKALLNIDENMSSFDKLSILSDNMLIFTAGFLIEFSQKAKVVLGGGTQLAAALLVADTLAKELNLNINSENITLATTTWVANDENSNIERLLNQLSFKINAVYAEFSFKSANIPILKLYDQGEAKEGVGAGSAIFYAYLNNLSNEDILREVESLMV